MDGGSGHLSASCIGSTMTITLDSTKPIHDITKLQYAYSTLSAWRSGTHGMRNCNTQTCKLSNGDRRVTITVPSAHGKFLFYFEAPASRRVVVLGTKNVNVE